MDISQCIFLLSFYCLLLPLEVLGNECQGSLPMDTSHNQRVRRDTKRSRHSRRHNKNGKGGKKSKSFPKELDILTLEQLLASSGGKYNPNLDMSIEVHLPKSDKIDLLKASNENDKPSSMTVKSELESLLSEYLFKSRSKVSGGGTGITNTTDVCGEWLRCATKPLTLLSSLPACPCDYPMSLHHSSVIYDSKHNQKFNWRDTSAPHYKNHVYRPGATLCIRSKPLLPSNMAAQQCCYDNDLHLITQGQGAGTPIMVSADVSYEIHFQLDIVPWIMCGGDWTRYHQGRQPDNSLNCAANPNATVLEQQIKQAQDF